ncbi:MAG TPA: RNase adapter RapZ [Lachnospiraceae bacterium]|nr:RNase adapter RapZ [Lachnospiraceae bacterium]MBQ4242186.1 RNase adapter RapZ [Lachnospiraceae bacterium]MCR4786407.1 RNase adapter RapZ [Lachnospiraceae bacterium]HAL32383.1 RNase adapter RapZ [Lachnospiraceae bacterium]HBB60151.1 RNase adapter RapZ [Lachnospiraceae bacterium]
MKLVIVTGMSGAGKSSTLKMLEDLGFFCIDNLPAPLIEKFADLFAGQLTDAPGGEWGKVAIGIDARTGLTTVGKPLEAMKESGIPYEIFFLDASDDVIVKRFKETRRAHPLAMDGRIEDGIAREREQIAYLKKNATYILDTSHMLIRDLKKEINDIYASNKDYGNLYLNILSFGFKYGIPADADLVFDVRFLPNPYYIDELKSETGRDKSVHDYVMSFEESHVFLEKLKDMLVFLIPNYVKEGKNQLVIAIGCTGGKHRSVCLAEEIYAMLSDNEGYGLRLEHRDIEKDAQRQRGR